MRERIGRFEVLGLLGKGAMGEVYLARDSALGREVALKTIRREDAQGPEARTRFEREARATAGLNHPNIVTIHDFGEEEGLFYLVMERVEGRDLETLIREGATPREDLLEALAQALDGLAFAHEKGVVHRDLKPSNILVSRAGRRLCAKLTDFGIARMQGVGTLTQQGVWMGTLGYMAPEYLDTGQAEAASDLFSAGVILYEILSKGRRPFEAETATGVLNAILRRPPLPFQPQEIQELGTGFVALAERALAKAPADRFPGAEALAQAIREAAARPSSPPASPCPAPLSEGGEGLVVGSGSPSGIQSLRVALRQARPGTRIRVMPGVYRESVVVGRELELVAEGDPGSVAIEASQGPGLVLQAGARVCGFELRGAKGSPALLVQGGAPLLESCTLVYDGAPGMDVQGSAAQPRLRACAIRGRGPEALHLHRGASCTLEDCSLEGASAAGIRAERGCSATLLRCTLSRGEGTGLSLQPGSSASLEACEVEGCAGGGLEVESEARATLRGCRLRTSAFAGLLLLERAQASLEGCTLEDHAGSAIHALSGATLNLRGGALRANPGFGLSLMEEASATLEDCEVSGNAQAGVLVRRGATLRMKGCRIRDGHALGVACAAGGRGVLEGCEVSGNAMSGARVEAGGSLLLVGCVIRDGHDTGLLIFEDAEATLEQCVVHRNARGGILLARDARDPILREGNRIEDALLRETPQGLLRLAPVKRG